MLYFENDYQHGAHQKVLERMIMTNMTPLPGYGADAVSQSAKERIRAACECPEADVFFLCGGTQTNRTVISSLLRAHEGVIAASTGHVSVHEAGAIEASGHKVIELPARCGKLDTRELSEYLDAFFADENNEHMVFPGMVYVSFPTELGTLYTKNELAAIKAICQKHGLVFYIDGARLGTALMSAECDITLPELSRLCDVFYIGGTKMGALIGEAAVFPRGNAPAHFLTLIKQNGALLAKGRLLGAQFDALFSDGLYFELGKRAASSAELLRAAFKRKGCEFYLESPTNQQFLIMKNDDINRLREIVRFSFWERYDETRSVVRFVTSWATEPEDIEALEALL